LPSPSAAETPGAADAAPLSAVPAPDGRERREFILTNGERIIGAVLSETPEAIYIDHGTLGVLTIPRGQIAQRPVEIILINGDRIIGDIVAETADTVFVRHASLGILTVPQNQRSTRVVEAILKDGDRILGEVLAETENFTVIRSATLGTVAVPHNRVAMLNRKLEQVQMKSLPPSAPELEDKPAS
jgi:RNase P/RNase MRP subunit p29